MSQGGLAPPHTHARAYTTAHTPHACTRSRTTAHTPHTRTRSHHHIHPAPHVQMDAHARTPKEHTHAPNNQTLPAGHPGRGPHLHRVPPAAGVRCGQQGQPHARHPAGAGAKGRAAPASRQHLPTAFVLEAVAGTSACARGFPADTQVVGPDHALPPPPLPYPVFRQCWQRLAQGWPGSRRPAQAATCCCTPSSAARNLRQNERVCLALIPARSKRWRRRRRAAASRWTRARS